FTPPATTAIHTLSLHDALPISGGEIVGSELFLRDGQRPAKHRLRVGGEALLEPHRAGIVEGRHEAGIVRRHRLLCDRESAVKYRSEEHTSELQSRSDLVCRLLL